MGLSENDTEKKFNDFSRDNNDFFFEKFKLIHFLTASSSSLKLKTLESSALI